MRVLKHKDQSFLAGTFAMSGRIFFSAAALLFFDLQHPDQPLPEKELWQLVKKRVPKPTPFDTAMPKPQAEVLVYGACHPRNASSTTQEAEEIEVSVGAMRKKLYVFGPRHWEQVRAGWKIKHDSPLLDPLPLNWQHAFGGPGFKKNPLGKGAVPLSDEKGGEYRPLPQIEYPDQLVGSIDDQPEPAALAPVDQTWPQRLEKAGTYDQKWLHEHWPQLPPDFDLRFFNTAPEDQQIKGYFKGDEPIRLQGLHPTLHELHSSLPGLRVRCFVTLLDTPRSATSGGSTRQDQGVFQELDTHLDTVWLFPEEMRAALCFRGVCEVKDEEYRDVASVMLVTESLEAPARTLEQYREMRDTWVDRMLKLDKSHLEVGKQSIAEALNRLKALPAEIEKQLDKGLGNTPRVPVTPQQQFASAGARLDASEALLDRLESTAKGLREKHGHLARIDLSHFAKMRDNIAAQRARLQQSAQKIGASLEEVEQQRQLARQELLEQKKHLAARGITADFDPDDAVLPPKEQRWKKSLMHQLGVWQQELRENNALYTALQDLGLKDETITEALLGYNPRPFTADRKLWGLEPAEQDTFTIPAGLVIPQFDGPEPVALRIRSAAAIFPPREPDHLAPGSLPPTKAPMLLSLTKGRIFVRVGDQLEGLLLAQEAGDICSVAVLESPNAAVPDAAKNLLQGAPAVVVALQGRDAEEVEVSWHAWRKALPDAKRLPLEHQGVCLAKRQGHDLRSMLRALVPADKVQSLPPEPEARLNAADVKPGMPLPLCDVKKLITESRATAKEAMEARVAPLRQEADTLRAQAMEQAANALRKQGLDPEGYLEQPGQKSTSKYGGFSGMKQELQEALAKAREQLARHKQLTPEIEQKMDSAATGASKLLDKAAALEQAAPATGGLQAPQWARELRAKHGLDPETGQGLTRERVAAMLQAGNKDFSGRNLTGLDLSGLDFSGASLSGAICIGASFRNANLQGARLDKAFCKQTDFSKANLAEVSLKRCLLHEAQLVQADLSGAACTQALFSHADCHGADFSRANLTRTVLLQTKLSDATLSGARLERTVFNKTELKNTRLQDIQGEKALFISCSLQGLVFAGVQLPKAVFMGCSGIGVDFSRAGLQSARFLKNCQLPKALFVKANLLKASAMDCDFSAADFSEAVLDKALLQNCQMSKTTLFHARARQARLQRCNLEEANMRGLDLLQGSLRKSRLVQADLSGANLFSVDFLKAVMGDTILNMAYTRRSLLEKREDFLPGS